MLQLESVHASHAHVKNQTRTIAGLRRSQKRFGRGEAEHLESGRSDQTGERHPERVVVVHDRDEWRSGHPGGIVGVRGGSLQSSFGTDPYDFRVKTPSLSAILTSSARESAPIFSITRWRCIFTVVSLVPNSPAICLLSRPATTCAMTSRSRCVREEYRLCNS